MSIDVTFIISKDCQQRCWINECTYCGKRGFGTMAGFFLPVCDEGLSYIQKYIDYKLTKCELLAFFDTHNIGYRDIECNIIKYGVPNV